MAAIFNRAGYATMRTCKRGNSYQAANQQFTVRRDATKRGDTDETGSAWVRDRDEWDADRYHPPATGYRSRLYKISRETSFYFKGVPAHNYDVNLGSFPLIWRIFPGF